MPLNKTYWDYEHAQSVDWAVYGMKYANKQIYANPNFSWGNLDYSFPTSFRKRNITRLRFSGNGQAQACETIPDCLIYNSMIAYTGNSATGSFYKDNYWPYYSVGNEGYFPVIDIDTHDFAYKMTVALFSNGNWITVNAVDFVNNYDSYADSVYGYINNYIESPGSRYTFCNYYVTEDSQFSVHANIYGYRTSGYGSVNQGGHVVSGQTAWSNRSIWQLAATTAGNYSNLSYPANSYFPFEIPELNGQSWNAGSQSAPAALITGGIYTNHAVLVYNDQRVYMPLKHILRDIIVNCGLVLLDSNDVRYISMVDNNGECQNKLVLMSSDEGKTSSIYNTRTSDNTLNPSSSPSGGITDKETSMPLAYISGNAGMVTYYEINKTGLASADDISDAISRFDIAQIGKDVLRNLISFKAFAAIKVNDTVDRQIKIAGIPLEDSGGNALTGRVIGGVKPIDLFPTSGGVTIPTLYNDYRDYEPYTKIQMYVPYCGWFALPSWCIGKKITGTMFTDLYNGTVKAVIYASQTVVAEVGGCCAYDIPFVADATGMKAGAVISSALTTAAAVGATVAMPNVATGIAAVSSAANLAATINGNDTTLKGVLGDGSNLNGLLHVYIKVSRPKSPNGVTAIPDSYKHEIGIPTMKEVTISAGDGYIQVMDAKVTGTMTAREKQMIVDGFRHGLNF